jgi:hypothetical protein
MVGTNSANVEPRDSPDAGELRHHRNSAGKSEGKQPS